MAVRERVDTTIARGFHERPDRSSKSARRATTCRASRFMRSAGDIPTSRPAEHTGDNGHASCAECIRGIGEHDSGVRARPVADDRRTDQEKGSSAVVRPSKRRERSQPGTDSRFRDECADVDTRSSATVRPSATLSRCPVP